MPGSPRLDRRTFLRGLGGTALALPWLEAMATAGAPTAPLRYLVGFGGFSLCIDHGRDEPLLVPEGFGRDYRLHPVAASLADLHDDVTWVSGLRIPIANVDGDVPPGGRHNHTEAFHFHMNPLLAGHRQVGDEQTVTVTGPSTDQVAADVLGRNTPYRSLNVRVQVQTYAHDAKPLQGILSYRRSGGEVAPQTPWTSPRQLFDALTTGIEAADPAEAARRRAELERRRSVLDFVDRRMAGVAPRLGAVDRQRLERHYDELRDLERRLELPLVPEGGACTSRRTWPEDPAFSITAHSDERERARRMAELVRLALSCDLTRVVTLQQTFFAPMLSGPYVGTQFPNPTHVAIHQGPTSELERIMEWHLDAWGELLRLLRATPDGDGTLLDHMGVVYVVEGGYRRYTLGDGSWRTSSHGTDDMLMLVSGRAGGMRPGRHVQATPGAEHPVSVMAGVLNRVGVPVRGHGEVEGVFSDL